MLMQGIHNLGHQYWTVVDPVLTDTGKEQCWRLKNDFPYHSRVELVLSSPLRRAIETAVYGFSPAFEDHPGLQLIPLPNAQEISNLHCDTGSSPDFLKKDLQGLGVDIDWSFVHEGWNNKVGMAWFCSGQYAR